MEGEIDTAAHRSEMTHSPEPIITTQGQDEQDPPISNPPKQLHSGDRDRTDVISESASLKSTSSVSTGRSTREEESTKQDVVYLSDPVGRKLEFPYRLVETWEVSSPRDSSCDQQCEF